MARLAFVYSGIGAQWPGMGRDLLAREAEFAAGLREFDRFFAPLAGWSVEDWLGEGKDVSPSFRAHPCALGIDFGLTRYLAAQGVRPDLCLGHSGGEVAAAWAAGSLEAREAAAIAAGHARLLENAAGSGAMLHLALPRAEVERLIAVATDGRASIAVHNAPASFVCAARRPALEKLAAAAEALQAGSARFLPVDVPFHGEGIAPFLDDFAAALAGIALALAPRNPRIPLVSALRGAVVENGDLGVDYWREHVFSPVRFADAMRCALELGARHFIEIAPHGVLQASIVACAAAQGVAVESTACMARKADALSSTGEALALVRAWRRADDRESGPALTEEGQTLARRDARARRGALLEEIRQTLIDLGIAAGAIEADGVFQSMGVTSLLAIQLAARISALLGLPLPVSAIFGHPSPERLAGYLAGRLAGDDGEESRRAAVRERIGETTGRDAAIAVVGAACRLPGGIHDAESYWQFIAAGRDAVIPIPAERWDRERYYDPDRDAPGKMYTREAAFLTEPPDWFDPFFFNISAKEARQLDPQQRLLLELAWRAFEDAGINPQPLRGAAVGVFLGMTNNEYSHAHRESYLRERIDAYSLTGTTSSGACGRLSYFFGFEGPCFSVDTACSSGIVALHCACQSLRRGESSLALVGAATLMLTPDLHICFTKLGAISPDGRSKAFDDGADGYGRGEGGVVLLLKRLRDAERDGDRILGLIRGTAINQDGKSNGLTAPNGEAQQNVIRSALADAGLDPPSVSYVEAHGTGTALGDAIELNALAAAYGRARETPLRIGSVKANIGHLEPASALASLAKILLCFRHRAIPGNIHIRTLNTRFDFAGHALEAPRALVQWTGEAPRRAGMSAFGFSGVNGHAILEEYVAPAAAQSPALPERLLLPLSARTPEALRELGAAMARRLSGASREEGAALCRKMATARPVFAERLCVSGDTPDALAAALGEAETRSVSGGVSDPVLLFTGQGSQYPNMGRELVCYPVFRASLEDCFRILSDCGIDGERLLFGGTDAETLADTALAQPLIAALSHALWRLWMSFGVNFRAVLGHSIGEYPAAVAAGILSLEDMLRLAVARGKAMRDAPDGAMAAVFAGADMIAPFLERHRGVVIAAYNVPAALTLSGAPADLEGLLSELTRAGIAHKRLHVSRAFHSPAMAGAAARFAEAFAGVALHPPKGIAFVSSVDGSVDHAALATPEYWIRQITAPVRFTDALGALAGFSALALEAGPSAALSGLVAANPFALAAVPTLSPGQHGLQSLFAAVGRLFRMGVTLDFEAVFAPFPRRHVAAPGYPFQKESFWMPVVNDPPARGQAASSGAGARQFSPALGRTALFASVFDQHAPHFVQEHVIFDQAISPAAGHMAMLLAAARELWGETPCRLSGVDFLAPLVISPGAARLVQVIVEQTDRESCPFRLVSVALDAQGCPEGEDRWQTHCTGALSRALTPPPADIAPAAEPPPDFGEVMPAETFYRCFVKRGYMVGENFQRIERISHRRDAACCRVAIRRGAAGEAEHVIYPGALDSVLQTILPPGILELEAIMRAEDALLIPLHVERLTLWSALPDTALCFSHMRRSERDRVMEGGTLVRNAAGKAVLELEGCLFRMTDYGTLYRALRLSPARFVHIETWREMELPPILAPENEVPFLLPLSGGDVPSGLAALPRLDAARLESELATQAVPAPRILLLHGIPGEWNAAREMADAAELLRVLQILARSGGTAYLLTRGLRPEAGPEAGRIPSLAGASLTGLAASFALEHPGVLAATLDMPLRPTAEDCAALLRFCATASADAAHALYDGKCYASRLLALPARDDDGEKQASPDFSGTHLVTGGTGALGLQTAAWLMERGASRVVLLSRSGVLPRTGEALAAQAQAAGCRLEVLAADVADAREMTDALTRLRAAGPPLRGVFHAAGVLDDGLCADLTEERLKRVLRPKIEGAALLDALTRHDDLAFFVCFSSAGSLIGSQGQANYNAANHFLNALCRRRQAEGLPAAAPCFGPWAEGGMADHPRVRDKLTQQGIMLLSGRDALDALLVGLTRRLPVFGVMDMDWPRFAARRGAGRDGAFALLPIGEKSSATRQGVADGFPPDVRDATGALRPDKVLEGLRRIAARLLGQRDPARIAPDTPLAEYGFDSLMAVEFRTQVGAALQMQVPLSLTFEYPALDGICAWLCGQRDARTDATKAASAAPPRDVQTLLQDIDALLDDRLSS